MSSENQNNNNKVVLISVVLLTLLYTPLLLRLFPSYDTKFITNTFPKFDLILSLLAYIYTVYSCFLSSMLSLKLNFSKFSL